MAKYYYSKYNATLKQFYNDVPFDNGRIGEMPTSYRMYPGYTANTNNGTYSVTGTPIYVANIPIGMTTYLNEFETGSITSYIAQGHSVDNYYNFKMAGRKMQLVTSYTRGILVQSDISAENGTYPSDGRHSDGYWYVRGSLANNSPIITLSTTDNRTLYENDTYGIAGSATDSDSGNVVSVKYQINGGSEHAITSGISTGASIPFNRSLTFKGGMLYDGSNAVTPALAESTTHSLRVWAEDDKSGKSAVQTRLFTVVANRPASLTIEPFVVTNNLIDSDTMTIKGNVTDPENNTLVVRYKVGSGSYVEVLNGVGGPFTIPIKLTALKAGANTVTIQATDSYGAVSSKTLNIAKSGSVHPLKTSVVRYKINPPNGTAKGVLLWIEREVGDLVVNAEISATMAGEAESFVSMTKSSTAFVTTGIEEDEFTHDAGTPKDNIVIKLTMTRSSTATNNGIKLISGVLS